VIPLIGALVIGLFISMLFWLDRDNARISKATWIPTCWLLIASSRPISEWLGVSSGSDAYVEGSPLDRNILTALLIAGLVVLFRRGTRVSEIVRANWPIILYFAYCGISLFWSDFPFVVLRRWFRSVGDLVMILVVITDPAWTDALKRLLTRISSVLIPLSILLIRCFPSLGRRYSVGGAPQWTGVGSDKNALGMLCMIYGVSLLWRGITVYLDRSTPHRSRQLTTIGLIFMMDLYLILVADSQTALSCFLMANLLIIVTALFKAFRRPALVSLLVAAMLSVAFCALFLGIGSSALSSLGRNASLTGRTDVWQVILPFATNPLVGAGYENFWIGDRLEAFKRIGLGGLNQAHNGYIEIYLNIGWVGLVILGIVIVAGYRDIMKGFRYRNPEMTRLRLAYFFICLVYNFTEASFKMMSPVWMMFLWSVMVTRKVEADKVVPRLKKRTHANIEVFSNEPGPGVIEHPVVPV